MELREHVAHAADRRLRVRAVGNGHSFTGAAIAPDVLIDMSRLDRLVSVDRSTAHVTVEAGISIAPALLPAGAGRTRPRESG